MRRFQLLATLSMFLCLVATPGTAAQAQTSERCFSETNYCLRERFREYWERSGGLPVFGFPIGAVGPELNRDTNQSYPTQWFERNRFELHTENAAPYDVLLGRLGDDRLRQLGVDWQSLPKARPDAPHYFAQTGQAITFEPFWQYWSTNGLELGDRAVSERESLALWGLPLTEARQERNASGDLVLTQWFERARFEYHPDKPDPYKVLLGLLGNEVRANGGTPPTPQPIQPIAYTALGDSLVTGIFAARGYVERYRSSIEAELKRPVRATNLGRNGWTSTDLLNAIKTDETFRSAVRDAQVVSWNIGGNDLNRARGLYRAGQCGGADNQDCLRQAVTTFKINWDAITAELLALRNRSNTLLVTMDIYNPYVGTDQATDTWAADGGQTDFQAFFPYFQDANVHIHTVAAANKVLSARVALAFNGVNGNENARSKGYIAGDGLHPNDAGHEVIAQALRELGYAPLQ